MSTVFGDRPPRRDRGGRCARARRSRAAIAFRLVVVVPLAIALRPLAAAQAAVLEQLGIATSSSRVVPSCPRQPCLVITNTTGFQVSVTGRHNAMVVRRAGQLVSWSIALAAATPEQTSFFDRLAHGPASAGVVVLRHGAAYGFRVIAASPLISLVPFFGHTMTFTLAPPLPVKKGDIVALSVPTWAPALAVALDPATAWRASRPNGACTDVFKQTAQTMTGALAQYQCVYHTTRLAYGATVAKQPRGAKSGFHGRARSGNANGNRRRLPDPPRLVQPA